MSISRLLAIVAVIGLLAVAAIAVSAAATNSPLGVTHARENITERTGELQSRNSGVGNSTATNAGVEPMSPNLFLRKMHYKLEELLARNSRSTNSVAEPTFWSGRPH